MNITLSASEEVVRRAREAARRQGKSLNRLLREYMEALAHPADGAGAARDLFRIMDEARGSLEGRTFTREELHDR